MITGRLLLPALEASAAVNTTLSANMSALPGNYQHGLFAAQDGTRKLSVKNSKAQMIDAFGDLTQTGDVSAVAVAESKLMYLPIPAAVTALTIHYYRLPAVLVALASPEGFSPQTVYYGELAMMHHAAARVWDDVEVGEDGDKVNTLHHEKQREAMIEQIRLITKEGVSRPSPPIVSCSW